MAALRALQGEKLAWLLAHPVPVVSLTFGLPEPGDIAALRRAGSRVFATVTTPAEASLARDAGVDGLVVQGSSAGGHSATLDPVRIPGPIPTATLLRRVLREVDLSVVATGGVDGPQAVRALLDVGAQSVAVGTLLLRTDEAGTSPTHRRALGDPSFVETVFTQAFTGRPARALRSGFVSRHPDGIVGYPAPHHLARALRQAAGAAGDADRLHLWAGTGWRSAPTGPAADVVRHLAGVVEPVETPSRVVEPIETPSRVVEPIETPSRVVEPVETP
ncbi:NAD(P)H-dependent flavin oxidoreductase [Tessaracoccus lacteus]|uniref:Propionate 3-nitronate monooxygenase n=1 Tax=Tessaracoccus lacteus TaxID=3041766 RepID=A0ABY8PY50_9ACTN|nr:nitronate monooxygenase [Tessaracoccus sp. T21]WGT47430.1 nitronate monooxygenase [Tessaracoccus sp. T21]